MNASVASPAYDPTEKLYIIQPGLADKKIHLNFFVSLLHKAKHSRVIEIMGKMLIGLCHVNKPAIQKSPINAYMVNGLLIHLFVSLRLKTYALVAEVTFIAAAVNALRKKKWTVKNVAATN